MLMEEARMCLKVQEPWPMPEETARVGRVILKEESPYRLIGEKLFEKFSEQDYADLYSSEGKPAVSPVILAFVTVFQFMERLPDRQAAESLRMRMDWKYALRMPLEYEGFEYSVLSEFRDRLSEHEAEGRVFEQLVSEFRNMGLIKERGRQRTDSIAMLMSVRRLSRLELVVETLRLAVGASVTKPIGNGQNRSYRPPGKNGMENGLYCNVTDEKNGRSMISMLAKTGNGSWRE